MAQKSRQIIPAFCFFPEKSHALPINEPKSAPRKAAEAARGGETFAMRQSGVEKARFRV